MYGAVERDGEVYGCGFVNRGWRVEEGEIVKEISSFGKRLYA